MEKTYRVEWMWNNNWRMSETEDRYLSLEVAEDAIDSRRLQNPKLVFRIQPEDR